MSSIEHLLESGNRPHSPTTLRTATPTGRYSRVAATTVEPLEARVAPASLIFTDVDGDSVKITTSGAGELVLGSNVIVTGGQLQRLDLADATFQGAKVSIVATRDPDVGGDGRVNVGVI